MATPDKPTPSSPTANKAKVANNNSTSNKKEVQEKKALLPSIGKGSEPPTDWEKYYFVNLNSLGLKELGSELKSFLSGKNGRREFLKLFKDRLYNYANLASLENLEKNGAGSLALIDHQRINNVVDNITGSPPYNIISFGSDFRDKEGRISSVIKENLNSALISIWDLTGVDLSIGFGTTTRLLSFKTNEEGVDNLSWHKTGRAVDIKQNHKWLIVKDLQGQEMYFKLFLAFDDSSLSTTTTEGNDIIVTFEKSESGNFFNNLVDGFKYKSSSNEGTKLVNVTKIFEDNGFNRIKAWKGWEKSWNKREWWHYQKTDNLTYYDALRQVYYEYEIIDDMKRFVKDYEPRMLKNGFPKEVIAKMKK